METTIRHHLRSATSRWEEEAGQPEVTLQGQEYDWQAR